MIEHNSSPIRVLHIIPTLTGGGAEKFVTSLLPKFNRDVVESAVVSVYPSDVPAALNVPVLNIERSGKTDVLFVRRLVKTLHDWKPTIVHTHLHTGRNWGRLAARMAGVPILIHTIHTSKETGWSRFQFLFDRLLNPRTDVMVTFTEAQRRTTMRAERLRADQAIIIPNGIRLSSPVDERTRRIGRDALGLNDDCFAIIVLGRLQTLKNQRLAIESMIMLPEALRRRTVLNIIGDGPDRAMLEELSRSSNVSCKVRFFGNRDDAETLLPGADLFLLPSLTEGMPLALLEAMSMGIPVLTTPWSGANDVLRNGKLGTILADWQPSNMAAAISLAEQTPAELQKLAHSARQIVRQEYSIESTARRHEELYERLVAARAIT